MYLPIALAVRLTTMELRRRKKIALQAAASSTTLKGKAETREAPDPCPCDLRDLRHSRFRDETTGLYKVDPTHKAAVWYRNFTDKEWDGDPKSFIKARRECSRRLRGTTRAQRRAWSREARMKARHPQKENAAASATQPGG